ncbi:MAG: Ig-like domain-containing protein [Marinilabiliales bacterium]|nr:Ig-like domain-containing protein [Marinilabiliales bacterium]
MPRSAHLPGGPKDTDPPVILKSQPENGTVLFSGKSFTVTFDEYVRP